jgi:hypothetical protein
MIRVSGYGQTGPYAQKAGYGAIGEAMGGMRYVAGDPSNPPSRAGISIGDTLAATFACLGGFNGNPARERTGRGQVVDSAIYEAVLAVMENLVTEYDKAGYIRERTGAILPNIAPSNVYPTKSGVFVLIAANQDTVFKRLAAAMGRPEMAEDPRYATHTARGQVQAELDAIISEWTAGLEREELGRILDHHGVPRGDIFRAPEMLEDIHFKARKAIVEISHPGLRHAEMQNVAPKLSDTPGRVLRAGPELGEHNREIFEDLLGYEPDRIAELAHLGIAGRVRPARGSAADATWRSANATSAPLGRRDHRGRPPRRAAERPAVAADGGQDRIHPPSRRRGAHAHRGGELRASEAGPANGGCGGRARGPRRTARGAPFWACPERARLRPRRCDRCAAGDHLRGRRERDLQPAQPGCHNPGEPGHMAHDLAPRGRSGPVPLHHDRGSIRLPLRGRHPVSRVVELARAAAEIGTDELSLADTIGVGTPRDVEERFGAVAAALPGLPLRAHFHNTRNTGYANADAAIRSGVRALDSSLGGIGGCPFAPEATGNIGTEDLVYLLDRSGVNSGLSFDRLRATTLWLEEQMSRRLSAQTAHVTPFPPTAHAG